VARRASSSGRFNCHARRSFDVGFEHDSLQTQLVIGCTATDCNNPFLCRNFREPLDAESQRYTYRDCGVVHNELLPSTTVNAQGFILANASSGYTGLGHVELQGCWYERTPTATYSSYKAGWAINANGSNFRRIVIKDFKLNEGAGTVNPEASHSEGTAVALEVAATGNGTAIDIDGIVFRSRITRSAAATENIYWRGYAIAGKLTSLSVKGIKFDASITNGDTVVGGALGETTTTVTRGDFAEHTYETLNSNGATTKATGGSTSQRGLIIQSSTSLTISDEISLERVDMSGLSGAEVTSIAGPDHTNYGKISTRRCVLSFAVAQGWVTITTTSPSSATVFLYQNLYGDPQYIMVGGNPEKVEVARGENVTTAASNNYVVQPNVTGTFYLAYGDTIRVTYTKAVGTGKVTEKSKEITGLTTSAGAFAVGQVLIATGVPANAQIEKVEGTTVTIDVEATASGTGVALAGWPGFYRWPAK
jgi:hypothetical protein